MKKIVVIPGVGLFNDDRPDHYLFKALEKQLPEFEVEWVNWQHTFKLPDTGLPYSTFRKWVSEVLLDYQMVIKNGLDVDIPEGDYYIGHSAGSILALLQRSPSIICGSPAALVEDLQGMHPIDCMLNSQPVFNLIHKHDLLAYPFPFCHVENKLVNTKWWKFNNWEPISSHTSYFNDKKICNMIVDKIKEWEGDYTARNII